MTDAGPEIPMLPTLVPPHEDGLPKGALEIPAASRTSFQQAKALETAGGSVAEREALWRQAIYEDPTKRSLLQQWTALHPDMASTDALVSLQVAAPTLIPAVISALLPTAGFEAAFARFGTPAAAWLSSDEGAATTRFWDAHAEGRAIDAADAAIVAEGDVATFAAMRAAQRRIIRGDRVNKDDAIYLASIGIEAAAMADHLNGFLQLDPVWAKALSGAAFATEGGRTTVMARDRFCGYQEAAVRDGTLAFRDPFSGKTCHPVDSCLLFGRSCYLYRGLHPFYLIGAGAGSKALCLYVPRFDLIVDFRAALSKFLGAELWANLLTTLMRRLTQHVSLHNAVMLRPDVPSTRRRMVVCIQQAQNFAHHVWNFYTGLERLVRAGLEDGVDRVIFGGTEFFGPLEAIYPEFEGRVEQVRRDPVIDTCPFSTEALLLTVGGYFIPASLTERLHQAMRRLPPREGAATPEAWLPGGKTPWPVVWIGMRTGDKSWVDQEDGIRQLIDALAARYPEALFLIDGFSYPVGRDEISGEWLEAMKSLRALAERICEACSVPQRVVNMVGNSLRESVLWARLVTVYLSPVGTTQHKIGWFTRAPGLVYSAPRGREISPDDRLPGSWESEGLFPPRYMIGRPVAPGERRGSGDRRAHLENIALDVSDILDALTGMLDHSEAASDR